MKPVLPFPIRWLGMFYGRKCKCKGVSVRTYILLKFAIILLRIIKINLLECLCLDFVKLINYGCVYLERERERERERQRESDGHAFMFQHR